ncbi:MAG: hypothetical protein EAX95_15345 [Candidatus Thorarchaeota archaeon]|nr:hypothetical protein [Candidatus Thorarchaeota archaeon]
MQEIKARAQKITAAKQGRIIRLSEEGSICGKGSCFILLCILAVFVGFEGFAVESWSIAIIAICLLVTPTGKAEGGYREAESFWEIRHLTREQFEEGYTSQREYSPSYGRMYTPRVRRPIGTRKPGDVEIALQSVKTSGGKADSTYSAATKETQAVSVLRGGEFIGNRMRFKVKVLNESKYTITDITVYILSFPTRSLKLTGKDDVRIPKIGPEGFVSPHFDFLPTEDCVKGEIVAGISYIDMEGKPHTLSTKPFVIRAVCDLLQPEAITPEEFELRLRDLHSGELTVKVSDWTPEEMHEKTLRILSSSNFREVTSKIDETNGITQALVEGWARGKYTSKNLGVQVSIAGRSNEKGASCRITVSGEDEAMILPAIDDLKDRLCAWLCPFCGSPLTVETVNALKEGHTVECPFCKIAICQ